jgi:heme-degrading monooxygenase HmoA
MIVEVAILRAKPGQADAMRRGLQAARPVIAQAEGYHGSTFHQGVEDPQRFVLRIEWESVDAHMKGFREGPLFAQWRSHFGGYLDGAPDMAHYEVIAGP